MSNLKWPLIVAEAQAIAESYDVKVTLRQLFYRLVAAQVIPNTASAYNRLSRHTAEARRAGTFPPLAEHGRSMDIAACHDSPQAAVRHAASSYRRDRAEGQPYTIVLGVEKNALRSLLWDWFADLGVGIVALGGVASETIERQVSEHVEDKGRPAVFIYAGDFDATGTNIDRVFTEHTDCWDDWHRIALNPDQIEDMGLPVNAGKAGDPNTKRFLAEHSEINASAALAEGVPVQVELDAVEPLTLRGLYQDALDGYWDDDAYQAVQAGEREDRERLAALRV